MKTKTILSALLSALSLSAACAGNVDGGGSPTWAGDDASAMLGPGGDDAGDEGDAVPSFASPEASPWGSSLDAASGPHHGADASTLDAGFDAPCATPLAPGVLVIDELLIESVAGTGDYGEWLEVSSTSSCAVNLQGLQGSCPVGMKVHSFEVTDDLWLAPLGTFVIPDSTDPAINHDLPGLLVPWAGQPGDVLRNKGGTVTLTASGVMIDSVTFPALKLVVGTSVAFPSNCPLSRRSDWTAWQTSNASWFPGFFGTPNAPNGDVSCP
jgi:hypothetical protein